MQVWQTRFSILYHLSVICIALFCLLSLIFTSTLDVRVKSRFVIAGHGLFGTQIG